MRKTLSAAVLAAVTMLSAGAASAQADLPLFAAKPADGLRVAAVNPDASKPLEGASAAIESPRNSVRVARAGRAAADDALDLSWKDAWYSALRIEGKPVDLRPYAAQGVLSFDLNVKDLSNGGLSVRMDCGERCERKVPFLLPARAMEGKGWQRVALPVSCFMREGDDFSAVSKPFSLDGMGSGEVEVANVRVEKSGTPTASCPDYRTVSVTPDTLNESWSISWWMPRHLAKLEANQKLKAEGKRSEVIFIGDSITEGWEKDGKNVWANHYAKYNAVALGFGGDRTENVLWRLQHGEVDGTSPKVVVLMFGTNNTGHRQEAPKYTAAGIKRNIDELRARLPDAKILLLGIFPRDEKPSDFLRQINEGVNGIISGFADNKHVYYLNINQAFLDKNGVLSRDIMPDLLHPNEKGYAIWAKAMAPQLNKMLRE
ncbi:GDSL-type esterase/lipase family protein [Pseudoduganella sp. UC29_106]|uniref:GDSL-type esterase/lipase family protein n=1 Tax=Pseudoduganella sp. UC29_106 TaxID=3374553 RepID=UPI0037564D94